MKVSIIIPVYNVEDYLRECVESVRQLRGDFQFVLVDDGSTDGSGDLCDRLAEQDDRILVIHQENGGLSAARNRGIRSAGGDFVFFLDSDDFLDPDETERMLAQLTPETDVLLGCYKNYYPDTGERIPEDCGNVLRRTGTVPTERLLEAVPSDGRAYYMIACRYVLRRSFLLEHDLFFLPGLYHEDEEWTQRVLCGADRVAVTDCFFYVYRQGRAGAITSGVRPKHLFDCLRIIERSMALKESQSQDSVKARYLDCRMGNLYLNILVNFSLLTGEDRARMLGELIRLRPCCAPHMSGTIGRAAGLSQRIIGTKATCWLLGALKKIKK